MDRPEVRHYEDPRQIATDPVGGAILLHHDSNGDSAPLHRPRRCTFRTFTDDRESLLPRCLRPCFRFTTRRLLEQGAVHSSRYVHRDMRRNIVDYLVGVSFQPLSGVQFTCQTLWQAANYSEPCCPLSGHAILRSFSNLQNRCTYLHRFEDCSRSETAVKSVSLEDLARRSVEGRNAAINALFAHIYIHNQPPTDLWVITFR